MATHRDNRLLVVDELRRELVGPDPQGAPLDASQEIITFDAGDSTWGPWHDATSGEEILTKDPPTTRYGVGVLFPARQTREPVEGRQNDQSEPDSDEVVIEEEVSGGRFDDLAELDPDQPEDGSDDLDLSPANAYQPSSMAISFLADLEAGLPNLSLKRQGADIAVEWSK